MQILYIMGQDSGGLPHYTAELANAVSEHATVTLLKPTDTTADDIIDPEINVVDAFEPTDISMQNIFDLKFNIRRNLKGLASYRNLKLVNEIDPDVVHDPTDEFPQVSFFAWLYCVSEDRPYVITSHEVEHGGSGTLLRLADLVTSAVPDFQKAAAIVHSDKQRQALREKNRNIDSIHVIPHGVYSFFRELDYTEREEEANHALFFGSLIPPKGIEFLTRAVPIVRETITDFSITIAGSGSIPIECSEIVERHADAIEIRNEFIPNDVVGELFSKAQLVILPYRKGWQTGHSGTLSIAFAFQKPVVTSRVGDFQELVGESGAGIVVEPENPEAIADAVIQILSNEQRREQMAEASARVAEELSWANVGKKHVRLYEELLDES